MMTRELMRADATALAELVRRGEVTPLELVDAAIERAEQIDPAINSIVHRRFDQARAAAAARSLPDGPFRGVPFLLKDIGARQVGVLQTRGNVALRRRDRPATSETILGRRFREAGLVTLGVTNIPEFGLLATTQPAAFGETRNPWDCTLSVGGSSGGAAAAVAAGIVPMAHGTDGGGSIRTPAAWCGLVGFKPSRGRMPMAPGDARPTSVEFAITRSVRDAAALLDATHGAPAGAPFRAAAPAERYLDVIRRPPARLRVGYVATIPGMPVAPDASRAAFETARLLESLGHAVDADYPQALFEQPAQNLDDARFVVSLRRLVRELGDVLRRRVTADDVEPFVWEQADLDGRTIPAELVLDELDFKNRRSARLVAWWARGYDLLVTPTEPDLAPANAELARLTPARMRARSDWYSVFTWPFNYSGQPAVSLPLGWTTQGLPIGVQLVAAPERDDVLLAVSRQLEEARPWADRVPTITAAGGGVAAVAGDGARQEPGTDRHTR